jgi:hypothetical protein
MHADEHVLERGHVREQPDVLERAAEAGHDHVVGSGAPEDPDPEEDPLIPAGRGAPVHEARRAAPMIVREPVR